LTSRLLDCQPIDTAATAARLALLTPHQLQHWHGLPMVYLDTPEGAWPHRFTPAATALSLLDTGCIEGEFHAGGRTHGMALQPGSLALFNGGHEVRAYQRGSRGAQRLIIDLEVATLARRGLLDEPCALPLQQSFGFQDPALAALLRAMLREVRQGCPHGALFAESLSVGLLLHLRRTRGVKVPAARERGRLSAQQHARLDELIAHEMTNALSLTSLGEALQMSKTHFVRLFRHTTGTSPHRYVMRKRVERAHQLIQSSDAPLADIAFETGFASQSHLNRVYRQTYGLTPGAAREHSSRAARR
jgi:AraC family transcriptional regulator